MNHLQTLIQLSRELDQVIEMGAAPRTGKFLKGMMGRGPGGFEKTLISGDPRNASDSSRLLYPAGRGALADVMKAARRNPGIGQPEAASAWMDSFKRRAAGMNPPVNL